MYGDNCDVHTTLQTIYKVKLISLLGKYILKQQPDQSSG